MFHISDSTEGIENDCSNIITRKIRVQKKKTLQPK